MAPAYPGGRGYIRLGLLARLPCPEVADILLQSIQPSTITVYSSSLKKWWQYCRNHSVPEFSPSTPQLIQFLLTEFQSGMSFSTLNCARSAVALLSGVPFHEDAVLKRFFKGIANARPALPRYDHTWDPQIVLNYLRSLPDNHDLPVEDLSRKLAALLLLTTGHRVQTIGAIKVTNIRHDESGLTIFIPDRLKTSSRSKPQPLLSLPFYPVPRLCAARTLQAYLKKTQSFRGIHDPLFLATTSPHAPVTTQTLSRWVKTVLRDSGVEAGFTAHSFRHAATSAAHRGGASIDAIFQAAGWTPSSRMFAKFYNRPLGPSSSEFAFAALKP